MRTQPPILQTLRAPASQELLETIIAEWSDNRTRLGQEVCTAFGFQDARGRDQVTGCVKALRQLEGEGKISLPARQSGVARSTPVCLAEPVPAPVDVPDTVQGVKGLSLVRVDAPDQRQIWNTLIDQEHPLGTTTFVGRQVRYLIDSDHGWLGAIGFSAAALTLKARDEWIGWDADTRTAHLQQIVGLSRFLIRPMVHCQHLASHVLGMVLRRVGGDFEARYGYRPWLVESFVEADEAGTCFQAANFVCVGQTAGRGRNDRNHDSAVGVKSIYMYSLTRDWWSQLGRANVPLDPNRPLDPGEGLDSEGWAENELGGAPLGDKRLSTRLVKSAALLAGAPGVPPRGQTGSDPAEVKGYYRLMEQADESGVTPENILVPHRERAVRRMRGYDTVLLIQDGSDFNFATRPGCEGLGIIGKNQTGTMTQGLHLHATLAVSDSGLPLGVMSAKFESPPMPVSKTAPEDPESPAREKKPKTHRWLTGLEDASGIAKAVGRKTRILSVMDREADCFCVFDKQRQLGNIDVLVRARHNRVLGRNIPKLFERLRNSPVSGYLPIEIDRVTARQKSSAKKAVAGRSARTAEAEVRFVQVELPPTSDSTAEPVTVWVIQVVEVDPPQGEPPVEWILLTSVEVESMEMATELIGYYLRRWRIEDFFRVLKTGCKAEHLAFRTAQRLERAITIQMVIAWRIMLMTLLGRAMPECPAEWLFSNAELRFLRDYAVLCNKPPPDHLAAAVLLVAILGGYANRKHDPPPGHQIMWRGYDSLSKSTFGYEVAEQIRKTREKNVQLE